VKGRNFFRHAITAAPSAQAFSHLTAANYTGLSSGSIQLLSDVWNSLLVAVGTAVLTAVLATLAGYGLSRLRFPGSGIVFVVILAPFMVPFQAMLTALFTVLVWLHLPAEELIRRLTRRALSRDENKIRDPASFLTGLDREPPAVPHLALDANAPTATLSARCSTTSTDSCCHRWQSVPELVLPSMATSWLITSENKNVDE